MLLEFNGCSFVNGRLAIEAVCLAVISPFWLIDGLTLPLSNKGNELLK